jgi:hypothetical protein
MVFLVWAIVLVCVSIGELLPGNSQPIALLSSANISDKVLHASAYALLALVPAFGFRLPAALCFAFATELIGIALEFAQLGVPERSYEPSDMLANTVGVLLGWAVGRGLGVLLDMGYSNDPDTWEQVSHRHDACETELICQDNQAERSRV